MFRSMTYVFSFLTIILVFYQAAPPVAAGQDTEAHYYIEFEAGPVWQSKNDVRLPGDSGTRFSFKNLSGDGPFAAGRLVTGWAFRERHDLKFTVAPLRVSGRGTFDRTVSFAGSTFDAGVSTKGNYKFDTYRLTYRYVFLNDAAWRVRAGGTLLLRDAEIELEQNDEKASDRNVGVVPLLSLAAEWLFRDNWSAVFDVDGLAGGPGRAFDLAVKLQYDFTERLQIGTGYRALEGGVDNDTAYNFAWFHYAFVSLRYRF